LFPLRGKIVSLKGKNILAGEENIFCRPAKKKALIIGNLPLLEDSSFPIAKYLYRPFLQERCEGGTREVSPHIPPSLEPL